MPELSPTKISGNLYNCAFNCALPTLLDKINWLAIQENADTIESIETDSIYLNYKKLKDLFSQRYGLNTQDQQNLTWGQFNAFLRSYSFPAQEILFAPVFRCFIAESGRDVKIPGYELFMPEGYDSLNPDNVLLEHGIDPNTGKYLQLDFAVMDKGFYQLFGIKVELLEPKNSIYETSEAYIVDHEYVIPASPLRREETLSLYLKSAHFELRAHKDINMTLYHQEIALLDKIGPISEVFKASSEDMNVSRTNKALAELFKYVNKQLNADLLITGKSFNSYIQNGRKFHDASGQGSITFAVILLLVGAEQFPDEKESYNNYYKALTRLTDNNLESAATFADRIIKGAHDLKSVSIPSISVDSTVQDAPINTLEAGSETVITPSVSMQNDCPEVVLQKAFKKLFQIDIDYNKAPIEGHAPFDMQITMHGIIQHIVVDSDPVFDKTRDTGASEEALQKVFNKLDPSKLYLIRSGDSKGSGHFQFLEFTEGQGWQLHSGATRSYQITDENNGVLKGYDNAEQLITRNADWSESNYEFHAFEITPERAIVLANFIAMARAQANEEAINTETANFTDSIGEMSTKLSEQALKYWMKENGEPLDSQPRPIESINTSLPINDPGPEISTISTLEPVSPTNITPELGDHTDNDNPYPSKALNMIKGKLISESNKQSYINCGNKFLFFAKNETRMFEVNTLITNLEKILKASEKPLTDETKQQLFKKIVETKQKVQTSHEKGSLAGWLGLTSSRLVTKLDECLQQLKADEDINNATPSGSNRIEM